jgi:hypothetical protein
VSLMCVRPDVPRVSVSVLGWCWLCGGMRDSQNLRSVHQTLSTSQAPGKVATSPRHWSNLELTLPGVRRGLESSNAAQLTEEEKPHDLPCTSSIRTSNMCYHCRVLGALINAGRTREGRFDCGAELADCDFRPTKQVAEARKDAAAEAFLRPTLQLFEDATGARLVPIKVDDDGSCMPHAVSVSLTGQELYFDALRLDLKCELEDNAGFYQSMFAQTMDESTWTEYWNEICNEAGPTLGKRTTRWLGPEHVLGLATVLARPVLVLDELSKLQDPEFIGSGLFLPLRLLAEHKPLRSTWPITVAWASAARNHFVSLVQTRPDIDTQLSFLVKPPTNPCDPLRIGSDAASPVAASLWNRIMTMRRTLVTNEDGSLAGIGFRIPPERRGGEVCLTSEPQDHDQHNTDPTDASTADRPSEEPLAQSIGYVRLLFPA